MRSIRPIVVMFVLVLLPTAAVIRDAHGQTGEAVICDTADPWGSLSGSAGHD
jgi:hypothetical protein